MRRTLAALVGVLLWGPTVAPAQTSRWESQVHIQLTRFGDLLTGRGYARTHQLRTGSLYDHEGEYFTLELAAGRWYAMLGVCDEDCSNMDLRLFDEAGAEVAADLETDDYPVLEVRPARTSQYRVQVVMATCSTSPCFYGVGVFGKQ